MAETLTGKVKNAGKNVFSVEAFPYVYFDVVAKGENFTLTDFDSVGSAEETAGSVVGAIQLLFQKTYECSPQKVDENNYNLNCRLI